MIVKVIDNFRFLLYDENVNVQKRAYLAMISVLKNAIKVEMNSFLNKQKKLN